MGTDGRAAAGFADCIGHIAGRGVDTIVVGRFSSAPYRGSHHRDPYHLEKHKLLKATQAAIVFASVPMLAPGSEELTGESLAPSLRPLYIMTRSRGGLVQHHAAPSADTKLLDS